MDIFSVFTLFGGLAFFLYGMTTMSNSLEKMAGGKLERLLKKMTSNPAKSLLLGAGITIAIQSSSAMTVMLVGLVNSGVMEVSQTVGVIMGSDIGTTLTAWILSLAGIESDNVFLNLLKPENFSPIFAMVGIILIMSSKRQKRRDVGRIMVGFSILMFGMELMKNAMSPLADMPQFSSMLTAFENPLLGVLVGTAFTGVIQSSAATIGIVQALALTGSITYGVALPVVVGANIGTCVTAVIGAIGVNREARQVPVIHISIKIIGGVVVLAAFYGCNAIFHFPFIDDPAGAVAVAMLHTIFNMVTITMLMPFSKLLVKMAKKMVSTGGKQEQFAVLDPLLMRTPAVATATCVNLTNEMGQLAHKNILLSMEQLTDYSENREMEINENEDKLDLYEDRLGKYLVEISRHSISEADSRTVARLLHAIGDFERIGDHAVNLQDAAQELHSKDLSFSEAARGELTVLMTALRDIMEDSFTCFIEDDPSLAREVEPLEETIDRLIEAIRLNHIERLQTGRCTIQLGFVLNDILTDCERVSDHCSNISMSVVEEKCKDVARHAYLEEVKMAGGFREELRRDLKKYQLPRNE